MKFESFLYADFESKKQLKLIDFYKNVFCKIDIVIKFIFVLFISLKGTKKSIYCGNLQIECQKNIVNRTINAVFTPTVFCFLLFSSF